MALHAGRREKKTYLLLATAFLALGLTWSGANLPFVPSWHNAKAVIVVAGAATVVLCMGFAARVELRRNAAAARRWIWLRIVAFGMMASVALGLVALGAFPITQMASEELAETLEDREHDRAIFVYQMIDIPDGIVGSRLAVREGCLPFEQTKLVVDAQFREVTRDDTGFLFRFWGNKEVRYLAEEGRFELVP